MFCKGNIMTDKAYDIPVNAHAVKAYDIPVNACDLFILHCIVQF